MTLPFHSAYFSLSCFLSILLWSFVCFPSLYVMLFFCCILFSSLLYSIALSVFFLYLTIRKSAELLYPSHCALTSFTIVCLLRNWLRKGGGGREKQKEREREKEREKERRGCECYGTKHFLNDPKNWTRKKLSHSHDTILKRSLTRIFFSLYFILSSEIANKTNQQFLT